MVFESQYTDILENKKRNQGRKTKQPDLTQSSVPSPQPLNPDTHNFVEICSELLRQGYSVRFSAPGGSMYPTIRDGDVITVVPIESSSVAVGDIVLYRHASGVAAHRIIRLTKRDYTGTQLTNPRSVIYHILRGDAAVVFDEPVDAGQILGKVTLVERKGRPSNPYTLKTIICYKARRLAARFKEFLLLDT